MSGLKPPATYKEQIEKLKKHGMEIADEDSALNFISSNNYYRFTGYAVPFRSNPDKSEYVKGTSFEVTREIYEFDEELRLLLLKYICIAEVFYRTIISYGFSHRKCAKAPHDQHYDRNNYYRKDKFDEVIESIRSEKNHYKDSLIVKHHDSAYNGKMPLWVIVELLSLSSLSKYYNTMYDSDKNYIAAMVSTGREKLTNRLHCLSVLRNKCAHWARLYGTVFNPSVSMGSAFFRRYPTVKNNSLFAYILNLGISLPNREERLLLLSDLIGLLTKYQNDIELDIMGFPTNWEEVYKNYMHIPQ